MSKQPAFAELFDAPVTVTLETPTTKKSRTEMLAEFFRERPNVWIDGLDLEWAGRYAWRSRVSECRTQLGMAIENRQRQVRTVRGEHVTVSEYRYVPEAGR